MLRDQIQSNASHPNSSYCLRQQNDTNSCKWTAVRLNWSHYIKHAACIDLLGCVVSSCVHQKFATTTTAWEGHSPQGHKYWLKNCRFKNHSLFSTISIKFVFTKKGECIFIFNNGSNHNVECERGSLNTQKIITTLCSSLQLYGLF